MRFPAFLKFAILLLLGSLCACQPTLPEQRPNVLFVAFDDLNDWEGCLGGHPQASTPNIDRLVAKGVLFSNAHCAGTMCCPSRASVISGLRPTTTGVYKNTDTPLSVYQNKQTLNRHFKENGYFVAGAGKILHRFHYEEKDWDEFVGRHKEEHIIGNRENPNPAGITMVSGNIGWGTFDAPDSLTFDGRTVEWVSERIQREHDKPFFLACGIFRPHIPWFNPQAYVDQYPLDNIQLPLTQENDLDDIPMRGKNVAFSTSNYTLDDDLGQTEGNAEQQLMISKDLQEEAVQAYLASVSYADAQFGKLLDALEESPYADNTIIVLWSDHGWHLGEKEHWRKGSLWEEVTRVPLIISAPGKASNRRSKQPVSLIDLYPTLVELCGLPPVKGLDGESLLPQLLDPGQKRNTPAISSLTPTYHAIRDEQYRYISYGDGQEELYDHATDPHEWTNLAADSSYAEVIKRLAAFVPQDGKEPVKGPYNRKNEK